MWLLRLNHHRSQWPGRCTAVVAPKVGTADARTSTGGEAFRINVDARTAAVTTMVSIADASREKVALREGAGRLVRMLRGFGGSDGLPSPTPPAVVCRNPRQ